MAEYVLIGVPLITGYVTSLACKMSSRSGQSVAFRPPSVVFGIVWPILYIMMGVAWCFSAQKTKQGTDNILVHIFNAFLVTALVTWMIVYACGKNKQAAVFVLLISVLLALAVYTVAPSLMTKLLVLPLVAWLGFATLMNATEVQQESLTPPPPLP